MLAFGPEPDDIEWSASFLNFVAARLMTAVVTDYLHSKTRRYDRHAFH